jgi:hypothetical protein
MDPIKFVDFVICGWRMIQSSRDSFGKWSLVELAASDHQMMVVYSDCFVLLWWRDGRNWSEIEERRNFPFEYQKVERLSVIGAKRLILSAN